MKLLGFIQDFSKYLKRFETLEKSLKQKYYLVDFLLRKIPGK